MKYLIFVFTVFFTVLYLVSSHAANTFPIFLKPGFSCVLEFEEAPTQVVVGDTQSFQIEKLNHSLVLKTNKLNASSNMFVYFQKKEPHVFILTAAEEVEPTLYQNFANTKVQPPAVIKTPNSAMQSRYTVKNHKRSMQLISAKFNDKKDYLMIEVEFTSDSKILIKPDWEHIKLDYRDRSIKPEKLWSQRKEVQMDSKITARFLFKRPNVPRNLKDVMLVVPEINKKSSFTLKLLLRS